MRKVKDIMTKQVVTVTPEENVFQVAVKMKEHDTGFIPVVEQGDRLIGVITDRDLVIRGIAEKHPGSTAVEKVMTRGVKSVSANTLVDDAADLMAEYQVRRLPVTDRERLIGIISLGDLAVRNNFADEAGEALSEISHHLH